jgi:hypothetical protein
MNPAVKEQEICVGCGFCCDGTLFAIANLKKGEKDNLPEKMRTAYDKKGHDEFFYLPCGYFDGKCTIYNQKKAHVCSAFRCKLLKDFAANRYSQEQAFNIIDKAISLRTEINQIYCNIFDTVKAPYFRKLISEVDSYDENKIGSKEKLSFLNLKVKSSILDALLTKYFKSSEEFEQMIEKNNNLTLQDS